MARRRGLGARRRSVRRPRSAWRAVVATRGARVGAGAFVVTMAAVYARHRQAQLVPPLRSDDAARSTATSCPRRSPTSRRSTSASCRSRSSQLFLDPCFYSLCRLHEYAGHPRGLAAAARRAAAALAPHAAVRRRAGGPRRASGEATRAWRRVGYASSASSSSSRSSLRASSLRLRREHVVELDRPALRLRARFPAAVLPHRRRRRRAPVRRLDAGARRGCDSCRPSAGVSAGVACTVRQCSRRLVLDRRHRRRAVGYGLPRLESRASGDARVPRGV